MLFYSRRYKKIQSSIQSRGMARKTIQFAHSKIHHGRGYDVDVDFTLTGVTATYYHIETGDLNMHLKDLELTTNKADVQCEIFKLPTISKNETPVEVVVFNSDDTSSNVCSMKLYSNSTITAEGTKRKIYYIPGAVYSNNKEAGQSKTSDEWEIILNKNSDYLIKVLRLVADGNTKVVMRLKMYEEIS